MGYMVEDTPENQIKISVLLFGTYWKSKIINAKTTQNYIDQSFNTIMNTVSFQELGSIDKAVPYSYRT